MKRSLKLLLIFSILTALVISVYVPVESAYGATGTSVIEVSSSSLSITAGASGATNYTVKLNSGAAGVTNLAYRSASGITAAFSTASGDPTFSGKMTVSVASSVKAGTYTLTLYATGDDPANNTNVSISVMAALVTKEITLHSEKTVQVYANSTSSYSVSVNAPGSYNLTVKISPGTYALINGTMESRYNFTLAAFNQNSNFPSPSTNYTVLFFFVFEVNGVVSKDISFVNSSGNAKPVITEINSPSNWTSWTFLGGQLINNGSAYNYTDGSYAFANLWSYNSTSHELVNTQFFSPVPWVFLEPAAKTVTKTPPPYSSLTTYIIIIVVVIIIIGAGVAVGLRSARKKGQK